MKKKLLVAGMLCFAPSLWAADLLQSWQAARKTDATFLAAQHALAAGMEYGKQADSQLRPQISLTAGMGATALDYDHNASKKDLQYSQYQYSLSLTQPVYRADLLAGANQQRKQAGLAEIQFRTAEQDLIQRVAKAYFDVVLAEEKIGQINAQKEAVSQQLAQAKKSFEVGVATITDVDAAQASFDGLLSQEIAALNDREVKYQAYAILTGMDPQMLVPVSEHLQPGAPQPEAVDPWLKRAQADNLSLQSQQLNLEIARSDVDKYKTTSSVKVDLSASYGTEWDGNAFGFSNYRVDTSTGRVMLQMSVPLYTGGNRTSLFRQAVAKQEQQRETLEAVRRETVQATRKAFLGVKAGAAQVRALEQSLKSNRSLLDSTQLGREVGVRTIVDVLNVQQQFHNTRYDLMAARCNYLIARLQLAAAIGALGESDLREVNSWLQIR